MDLYGITTTINRRSVTSGGNPNGESADDDLRKVVQHARTLGMSNIPEMSVSTNMGGWLVPTTEAHFL